MEDKHKLSQEQIIKYAAIAFMIIMAVCLTIIICHYINIAFAQSKLVKIRSTYIKEPTDAEASAPPSLPSSTSNPQTRDNDVSDSISEYNFFEREIDFTALKEEVNSDIYAWITIPDTEIDYPLVQHPTDDNYYLNHRISRRAGYPGCIYTENYNSEEWEDANTIIYGHNMKNGSMFADLHEYQQEVFFKEHPYIYVYSPGSVHVYQVFAAYEYTDEHLSTVCNWNDSDAVAEYLSHISDYPGIYNADAPVEDGSRLLTLSTCISDQDDKRFLVQAVLLDSTPEDAD